MREQITCRNRGYGTVLSESHDRDGTVVLSQSARYLAETTVPGTTEYLQHARNWGKGLVPTMFHAFTTEVK
jgi:hypothetical protein